MDLSRTVLKDKPDIVYSLHACDIATDMAIAAAIKSGALNILTVSCCQHTVKKMLRSHPLTQVTRHGAYKERLADMLSDSMRSLLLESRGYKVKMFEFTANSVTPKNIMLKAVKVSTLTDKKKRTCIENYFKLKQMFNTEPKLNYYLTK